MQETWVRSLGWEDLLEKGMATHSSILAWRIPWTEQPGSPWGRKESDTVEQLTQTVFQKFFKEEFFFSIFFPNGSCPKYFKIELKHSIEIVFICLVFLFYLSFTPPQYLCDGFIHKHKFPKSLSLQYTPLCLCCRHDLKNLNSPNQLL